MPGQMEAYFEMVSRHLVGSREDNGLQSRPGRLLARVVVITQLPVLNYLGFASRPVFIYSALFSLALVYLLAVACGLHPGHLAARAQPAEALHYE